MRPEPIHDPEGDRVERQERADRFYDKTGYFGEGDRCPICDLIPKPLYPGMYVCGCVLPVAV